MLEEITFEDQKRQRRKDMVKNAAIVFLAILLLLTFFSNTIMNYTLPEVATQQIESGTISPQIRGSGTVSADNPYNVTVTESRKIASVAVKAGDEVKKDDVIYYLEDRESKELEDARKELDTLELAYEQALFSGDIPDAVITRVRNGKTTSFDAYQAQLKDVNDRYVEAVRADEAAEGAVEMYGLYRDYDTADIDANVTTYAQEYNIADLTYELSQIDDKITERNSRVSDLKSDVSDLKSDYQSRQSAEETKKSAMEKAKSAWEEGTGSEEAYLQAKSAYESAVGETQRTRAELTNAEGELEAAEERLNSANRRKRDLNDALNSETRDKTQLETYRNEQENEVTQETNMDISVASQTKVITAQTLKDVTKEREDLLKSINVELNLFSQKEQIEDVRQKIAKLQTESVGASIRAPVDGTVSSLAYVAGESTSPDAACAVIQVAGKPKTMSFSVTNEQAKKLKLGDIAEPQNAWYYTQFQAKLKAIRPDSADPSGKKQLEFEIDSPEVEPGQTVSIKIGESEQRYDMTVPNSAVREDNNGKFILIVETRSSPLGNRYIARRADVEVRASDDTRSAVTGSLEGYEYVITTSTGPVQAGDQVRLSNANVQ